MGLLTGLISVAVAQSAVCVYSYFKGLTSPPPKRGKHHGNNNFNTTPIQRKGVTSKTPLDYASALQAHLTNPEGFALLGTYLITYWMSGLMPKSYYSMTPIPPSISNVALQLIAVDLLQYLAHRAEHLAPTWAYVASHKPHHRHTDPNVFQAFDGSVADTVFMILLPLLGTAVLTDLLGREVTVWEYMAFGSVYSSQLCLIHSNSPHRFELLMKLMGIGTTWDHHVHHSMFRWNYGHLLMWWDKMGGTYREGGERFNKVVVG